MRSGSSALGKLLAGKIRAPRNTRFLSSRVSKASWVKTFLLQGHAGGHQSDRCENKPIRFPLRLGLALPASEVGHHHSAYWPLRPIGLEAPFIPKREKTPNPREARTGTENSFYLDTLLFGWIGDYFGIFQVHPKNCMMFRCRRSKLLELFLLRTSSKSEPTPISPLIYYPDS